MMLYKYYDAVGGLHALRSRKLGFRIPTHFNDPFELTALSNGDGPLGKQDTLRGQIQLMTQGDAFLLAFSSTVKKYLFPKYTLG